MHNKQHLHEQQEISRNKNNFGFFEDIYRHRNNSRTGLK